MLRVRAVHWKAEEAEPFLDACRAAGFEVEFEAGDLLATMRAVRKSMPDALVIDLTRAPRNGRELAHSLRGTKYTRHIPIIFVDGLAEKVAGVRGFLPDAAYCARTDIKAAVASAVRNPIAAPVTPPTLTQLYGGRTTAQKLGIQPGMTVALFQAPRGYSATLGELPEGAELVEDPEVVHPLSLWFVTDPRTYQAELPRMRRLALKSKLWVIWTKGAKNGLSQNLIRETGIEAGLVDYKICSLDDRWSGMLFAVKKKP